MKAKKCIEKIFIGVLCFSLFFSSVNIPVNAGSAGAVGTTINIAKMLDAVGKTAVTTVVGKTVENLVNKWFSGEKEYYDSPGEKTTMDYYANNSAINKATGSISNSGANNENCYNTFSSTVTENRTYSLIKDSYNSTTNNYSTLLYNPITNNYTELNETTNIYHNEQYDTYYIENNEYNYYVTNNYTYVSYYIINNETDEESYYEIYYEMPDGRNSYDLEKEDIWGEYFIYDVVGYESVPEDDGTTLALYHFDGDGKDSSYWKNSDASLGSGVFTDGKFGQGIIVSPGTQIEIHLKNELDLKNFALEMSLLNSGGSISGAYFMIEDIVFLKSNSLFKNGINSLVFQGGSYALDLAKLPIVDAIGLSVQQSNYIYEDSWGYSGNSFKLNSDSFFYCNGGKVAFAQEANLDGVVFIDSIFEPNGKSSVREYDGAIFYKYDLVSAEKVIPNVVENNTGIYIFKDSIVIKNTSSQSIVLDELRLSNSNLYSSDTISVPAQPFDTNQVLVLPENPIKNMIAVQGKYPVSDFRVGGVRPTYPTTGYVYIYLEDDVVKDIQQYEGDAWCSINGAIYQDGEWSDLSGCNLSTLRFEEETPDDDSGSDSDKPSGGSDNDSSGGSVSGNGTGGSIDGIGDLLGGIGKLFDTILSLIGKIMGVVADFSQSVLDLFSGFTTFTDGFSSFLSGAFGFIPSEILNALTVGISLAVILAVVKFLRG